MRLKSTTALTGLAITVGLLGFAAMGCQELTVPGSIESPDSSSTPGLDDPNPAGPGGNVVPLEESGLELERKVR